MVSKTDAIAITQQLLRGRGHHDVPVDGRLGATTVAALEAFQRTHGLPVTGEPDHDTVLTLRGRPVPKPDPAPGKPGKSHPPVHHSDKDPFAPARFPLNRVLMLLGPVLALVCGSFAAWLSQHFPGLVTDVPATRAQLTQVATFVVGAVITWAMHHKYLDGWQRWETGLVQLELQRREQAHDDARRSKPTVDTDAFDDDPAYAF